jgi:histidinol-phosphate/aromatic aminotransferase/cobyric acid decarboxylase-like protein/GNAT superfamily N-acetyltransferase
MSTWAVQNICRLIPANNFFVTPKTQITMTIDTIKLVRQTDYCRKPVNRLRDLVLVRELRQYDTLVPESSEICIAAYSANDDILGYIAINRPEDGHKTPHVEASWKTACEIRGLIVHPSHRRKGYGRLLMHAALRFVSEYGCELAIASARKQLVPLYVKFGFIPCHDASYLVGEQVFVPGSIQVNNVQAIFETYPLCWDLPFRIEKRDKCIHGNGSTNDDRIVIRADVLDAPYPPAPLVRRVRFGADKIRRTPPDTDKLSLAISKARGIPTTSILPAPGSSALMYTVFPQWFNEGSSVLLVTPSYAEYPHILKEIGCDVYEISETMDVCKQIRETAFQFDGIVIVNPNSPSGKFIYDLKSTLRTVDSSIRVWVDETYIDYVGDDGDSSLSIEQFAATTLNVTVCKSMSKYYALSGARMAYLVGHPMVVRAIISPPWWVPEYTQRLAMAAIDPKSKAYYRRQSGKVRDNLKFMITKLEAIGMMVVGTPRASFATFTLMSGIDAQRLVDAMKSKRIYIRLAVGYPNSIRIAAQDYRDTRRLVREMECTVARLLSTE